jgi:hypothetical protein
MTLLTTLGTGQGYLKAGFLGFSASGKTRTAVELAAGTRKWFGLDGPLAMFDTEGGSEYIAPLVRERTGRDLVGVRSRAFDDLMQMTTECQAAGVAVLIVDSITHVWQEASDARLKQVNDALRSRRLPLRTRLEFQDLGPLKALWGRWTDLYLNAPMHIIVCGRAGFMWDFEKNEETQKKELVKTGIKMKVESEFAFEPSLLVEMDREQIPDGAGGFRLQRRATVIKDRFGVIDGQSALDPGFDFFQPHVALLTPLAHAPVDTSVKSDLGVDETGDDRWTRERKLRTILAEEIQSELVAAYPGQDGKSKQRKIALIKEALGTGSWTQVENLPSDTLRAGLAAIRVAIHGEPPADLPAEPEPEA